ncbi:hypothetical protein [Microbispora rosea]|uniref:hypothetical protein n=1 Tax=Microbispora rosea TaxID=58117 RepID=UPI00343E6211
MVAATGMRLETVAAGPCPESTDLYYYRAKLRETEESGVLLVHPDTHIARRAMSLPGDPAGALRAAGPKPLGRA